MTAAHEVCVDVAQSCPLFRTGRGALAPTFPVGRCGATSALSLHALVTADRGCPLMRLSVTGYLWGSGPSRGLLFAVWGVGFLTEF